MQNINAGKMLYIAKQLLFILNQRLPGKDTPFHQVFKAIERCPIDEDALKTASKTITARDLASLDYENTLKSLISGEDYKDYTINDL